MVPIIWGNVGIQGSCTYACWSFRLRTAAMESRTSSRSTRGMRFRTPCRAATLPAETSPSISRRSWPSAATCAQPPHAHLDTPEQGLGWSLECFRFSPRAVANVSEEELGCLDGVTSDIQSRFRMESNMHWRLGTPGKMHSVCLSVWSAKCYVCCDRSWVSWTYPWAHCFFQGTFGSRRRPRRPSPHAPRRPPPGALSGPECTNRATSANVRLPYLQKDLRTCSIPRDIANFPSELCWRRSGTFAEVARSALPDLVVILVRATRPYL